MSLGAERACWGARSKHSKWLPPSHIWEVARYPSTDAAFLFLLPLLPSPNSVQWSCRARQGTPPQGFLCSHLTSDTGQQPHRRLTRSCPELSTSESQSCPAGSTPRRAVAWVPEGRSFGSHTRQWPGFLHVRGVIAGGRRQQNQAKMQKERT